MTKSISRRFVVAFNRDRDFYQLPLALEEEGLLAGLVTDFYSPALGPLSDLPILRRASRRHVQGLPFTKVAWNWPALRMQLLDLPRARDGAARIKLFKRLDRSLSRAALRLALRKDADLFLYSGYAREAFESPAAGRLQKGLFVFHPHGRLSLEILEADLARHPEAVESHRWHRSEIELSDGERLDAEARAADFLVCASSFTAKSLNGARQPDRPVTVAPYGCIPVRPAVEAGRRKTVKFLFVGQGVQRKGLHHLLKVWRRLRLQRASLTVVASSMDPGIGKLANQSHVSLRGAQSRNELQRLYHDADVFVMPSLVEGFGLVYLEAIAAGCFVIGTENTGLPDLGLPDEAGCIVPAGDLKALGDALERAFLVAGNLDRRRIQAFSHQLSWQNFRQRIAEVCNRPPDFPKKSRSA